MWQSYARHIDLVKMICYKCVLPLLMWQLVWDGSSHGLVKGLSTLVVLIRKTWLFWSENLVVLIRKIGCFDQKTWLLWLENLVVLIRKLGCFDQKTWLFWLENLVVQPRRTYIARCINHCYDRREILWNIHKMDTHTNIRFIRIGFLHPNEPNPKSLNMVFFRRPIFSPNALILSHTYHFRCMNIIFGARKGVLGVLYICG